MRWYAESPRAAVVVAFDGERPVGASTCIPLADEAEAVTAPFRARGWALERFFYFGRIGAVARLSREGCRRSVFRGARGSRETGFGLRLRLFLRG